MTERRLIARRAQGERPAGKTRKLIARAAVIFWAAACVLPFLAAAHADEIELTNGTRYQGRLIEQTPDDVTFQVIRPTGTATMTFPNNVVQSIKIDGKYPTFEKEVSSKPASSPATRPRPAEVTSRPATTQPGESKPGPGNTRTRAEVESIIQQAGKTPPDWWDSVPLKYPPTLDLTWTNVGGWNTQRNLGPYLYGVVTPNPGKWKEGVKLLHQCLTVNAKDPAKLTTTIKALARAYSQYFEDWARSAFWWRKAGGLDEWDVALGLAECYWKLGCPEMAREILLDFSEDPTNHCLVVRLWAEIGELDKALALAKSEAEAGYPDPAYIAAGEACRRAGKYKEALAYFEKVAALKTGTRQLPKNKTRAQANIEVIKVCENLDLTRIADGRYTGGSMGFRGTITVEVVIRTARIESVRVTQHKEDWFYTSITEIPRKIVEKQGIKGVDAVTGATVTSNAIINAAVKALASGLK